MGDLAEMPRIDTWLAAIGLEKYVSVFEDAEIDFDTLPDLVESDLKELQLPLGPRRKIWSAITRMAEVRAKEQFDEQPAPSPKRQRQATDPDAPAERRHLTVMFVDLVGSTALSSRLDAEDMRTLIARFQSEVANVVTEFDGFVAQFLGDGVLCYFGWPHANEDDTERAVRAGLLIIETIRKLSAPDGSALSVRVGIATGVVIVGDLMMNGTAQEAAAVGETTNLAARLQGVAGPNRLVVSSDALPLLGAAFDMTSLGELELKGIGQPIEAFVVNGETAVESRFAARRPIALTPIVGRDREIGRVLHRWSLAQSGRGQMVLLRGEAGIGKSRLVQTVTDAVATDEHTRITYQCSPYHKESAFYPFVRQVNFTAGIVPDDTTEQRLAKMEAVVAGSPKANALMAVLLGIDGSARYGKIEATPAQLRAQTMRMLLKHLVDRSEEKPLLLILEDLHWVDPTSLELIQLLLDTLPRRRIMVLATARPSFSTTITERASVTELALTRLDKSMTGTIAAKMAGGKTLPDAIIKAIASRTDGVPLFVEELTKSILESGALKDVGDSYQMTGSLSDITIPATLHDSLMARLDRLGSIKEIAQIAACVGREFSYKLMLQVCELTEFELEEALDQLITVEMIHVRGTPPDAIYSFKHALVRDAAYDGLLKERRMLYHRRILSALETDAGAARELLATHAEAAQLSDQAIDLWEDAGKAAIARPAYEEAQAHLRRAISLNAPKVAAGEKDALLKAVALKVHLFVALSPGVGLWADETVTTLEEALALADQAGDSPLRGDIISGLVLSTYFRGSLQTSLARAGELRRLADASGDIAQILAAKRIEGIVRLKMGRLAEAEPYLSEAAALCDQVADLDLVARFGHDPIVGVKIYQTMCATYQGRTALAGAYMREADSRCQKIAHTNTTCAMLGLGLICTHASGDLATERRHLGRLQLLIEEHAVTASNLWAEVAGALLRMADGDVAGIDAYRKAETTLLNANIRLLVPGNRVLAAQRAMALGLIDVAEEFAAGAAAMMAETGEKSWEPEYHRTCASLASRKGDRNAVAQHLTSAIEIAQRTGGSLWEFRATIDLAALYQETNRNAEAITMLEAMIGQIAEGDCPAEMEAANALLAELRA